jgi:hypothetical protein
VPKRVKIKSKDWEKLCDLVAKALDELETLDRRSRVRGSSAYHNLKKTLEGVQLILSGQRESLDLGQTGLTATIAVTAVSSFVGVAGGAIIEQALTDRDQVVINNLIRFPEDIAEVFQGYQVAEGAEWTVLDLPDIDGSHGGSFTGDDEHRPDDEDLLEELESNRPTRETRSYFVEGSASD